MPKTKITPPAPPDVKGLREVEKATQAAMAAAPHDDEEISEETTLDEIRGDLHDALESIATALQRIDDLEEA